MHHHQTDPSRYTGINYALIALALGKDVPNDATEKVQRSVNINGKMRTVTTYKDEFVSHIHLVHTHKGYIPSKKFS